MKITQNIKDYSNFLFKNGYKIIVDPRKVYEKITLSRNREFFGSFLKNEIYEWIDDNNIYCRFKKIESFYETDNKSTPILLCEIEFLHKEDAVLFKLWLT